MKNLLACACLGALLTAVGCGDDKDVVTPPVDTGRPTVTITRPSEGGSVAPGAVSIAARATDNVGVVRADFFVDGSEIGTDASGAQDFYEYNWTATLGAHALRVVAFDAAGNAGSDSVHVVCVAPDVSGPVVTITTPESGAALDEGTVAIRATATDESGVVRVEFFADDLKLGEDSVAVAGVYEQEWAATTGRYSLTVVAQDSLGNTGADTVSVAVGPVWQIPEADPAVFCPDSTGTMIHLTVQEPSLVEVRISRSDPPTVIRTLVNGQLSPGPHAIAWDGRDDLGQNVPDGTFYCGMTATYGGRTWIFPSTTVTLDCSVSRR